MYRTVDGKFWHDAKVRKLSTLDKYTFLYLLTNPHAHFSGLYYLPEPAAVMENGMTVTAYRRSLDTLSGVGVLTLDTLSPGVLWVKNMLSYQSGGQKQLKGVAKYLLTFNESPLLPLFLEKYTEVAPYFEAALLSKPGYPIRICHTERNRKGTGEEQEQERDCSEPEVPASEPPVPPEPAVLVFSAAGNASWGLTQTQVESWREAFPGIDVLAECRKAMAWSQANPTKRKTVRGMPAFLVRWLSKAQDSYGGRGVNGGSVGISEKNRRTFEAARQFLEGGNGDEN